jgi:3-deoxy-D-manno-octulosonic-acid transferase
LILYDLLLILGALCALPKWLTDKKYRGSISARLGLTLPKRAEKKPLFWFHMVSMGETKAISSLYARLHKRYPHASFYLSSTTKTGHEWAQRLFPEASAHFYLPIDFSWTMKRLAARLQADLLFLSESDFWYNMCRSVRTNGGKVLLLNGKISEKSKNRFAKLSFFSKKLFAQIDHFCVQSPTQATRFQELEIPAQKVTITGNLKLATSPPSLSEEEKTALKKRFQIAPSDLVITLGSTHAGEEALLLPTMPPDAKVLVVPRHPSRFSEVKKFLSDLANPNWILVDQMGILPHCYAISNLAIVGGSFLPGVGGHNIFEPIQAKIPVLFGPHMETQLELVEMVIKAGAGIQTPAETLPDVIARALLLKKNAEQLSPVGDQVLEKTWDTCTDFLP